MKKILMAMLLIGLVCHNISALAEEHCWPTIRKLLQETKTREEAQVARKYLESLTAEQLIVAGRDCGREIQNAIDSGKPGAGEGVIAFGFFSVYYPHASGDLRDIAPILREIRDKSQPTIWRSELIGILLGRKWDAKLTTHQRKQVFASLEKVLNDKTEVVCVRQKIPTRLANVFLRLFKKYSNTLQEDFQDTQTEQELNVLTEQVSTYLENTRKLISDSTTPLILRKKLLTGMTVCYKQGIPCSGTARDFVIHVVANYRDYPESLWPQIAYYVVDDLHIANADTILDKMISQADDKMVKKKIQALKSMGKKGNARNNPME